MTTATPTTTATFVPTPTVSGPTVFVPDRVNVRSGPGTYYEKVGVLVAGQFAPAVGRTAVGEWIAIEYPDGTGEQSWVYSPLVVVLEMDMDDLPEVESPPTSTLPAMPAAGFTLSPQHTQQATRLPTFTPAPPLAQPTFVTPEREGGVLPPIVLIVGLFTLGIISGMVAIFRQRR
ncbi:MAG: SH3 domain-containing protein [Gammaproteobacteria bacterium]|nr:SH3 domain-containing protein [Gammaproteobacteria bacterium]